MYIGHWPIFGIPWPPAGLNGFILLLGAVQMGMSRGGGCIGFFVLQDSDKVPISEDGQDKLWDSK